MVGGCGVETCAGPDVGTGVPLGESAGVRASSATGMPVGALFDAVGALAGLDVGVADRATLVEVLGSIARAEACLAAARAVVVHQLALVSSTVELDIAAAGGVEVSDGVRAMGHAEVLGRLPAVSAALAEGRVLGWVPGVIAGARAALPAKVRAEFDRFDEAFVDAAARCTRREFADLLRRWADGVMRDHGLSRRARQRAAMRCRAWTATDSGMFHVNTTFDPDRGVVVSRLLEQTVRELLADTARLAELAGEGVPLPDDPGERVQFARALALHLLITGDVVGAGRGDELGVGRPGPGRPGPGRPEVIVVVDRRAESCDPDGRPSVDTGTGVDLSDESVDELLERAVVHIVEVDDNRPIAPDHVANRGRSSRHATPAQRRLLRAVHPGCVVPGCRAPFERCQIHHLIEWERGGPTDLDNLVPLCPHHHAWLHRSEACIRLGPRRSAEVSLADGTTLQWSGPSRASPSRPGAAAGSGAAVGSGAARGARP